MTDEQALNRALDDDPGDVVTRGVLSDLLEEQGRLDEAEGQRWLIRVRKWPTFDKDGKGRWDWWPIGFNVMPRDYFHVEIESCLSDPLWLHTESCVYDTRQLAESDLIDTARRIEYLGAE